jgi:hypothetical protein
VTRRAATGRWLLSAALLAVGSAGCDPVVNVFGSFFPAWVVCMIAGVGLAAAIRPVFVALRLEPHLGPLLLVYPSLALLLTMLTWLVCFRT